MWDTWLLPHRGWVLQFARAFKPTSLYEVGCGSGPNLRLLQKFTDDIRFGASEPHAPYADWAREHLKIPIENEPLEDTVPTGWDCVLSSYVMAYLEPPDVLDVLTRLRDAGNKSLLLLEPSSPTEELTLHQSTWRGEDTVVYAHGWGRLLPKTGWTVAWGWPIVPIVDGLNAVVVATPV